MFDSVDAAADDDAAADSLSANAVNDFLGFLTEVFSVDSTVCLFVLFDGCGVVVFTLFFSSFAF